MRNGRTGRALALWELYRRGFDSHHIFSVDEYDWADRPGYEGKKPRFVEPLVGFEPTTCSLRMSCSTPELQRLVTFPGLGAWMTHDRF